MTPNFEREVLRTPTSNWPSSAQRFWLSYLLNLHFVSTALRSMISSILRGFFFSSLTNTKFHHGASGDRARVKVISALPQTRCSNGVRLGILIDSSETCVLQPVNGPERGKKNILRKNWFWRNTKSSRVSWIEPSFGSPVEDVAIGLPALESWCHWRTISHAVLVLVNVYVNFLFETILRLALTSKN